MTSIHLSDIYTLNIKNANYRFIMIEICKSEAIKLLQNIDLTGKNGAL